MTNPTLPLISMAMMTNPGAVVIESTPNYRVMPGDSLKYGEPAFAAALASAKSVPYIGGEAGPAEVFQHLEKQGYSSSDAANFYILRSMVSDKQLMGLDESRLFQLAANQFPLPRHPSWGEFNRWFDMHNISGKSLMDMESIDVAPTRSEGSSYFNTISHHVSTAREMHLNGVIADAINRYGSVVVVYGEGHHVKSASAYESALGPPTYQRADQASASYTSGHVAGSRSQGHER